MSNPRTLSQKVWDRHVVRSTDNEPDLLFIDLHLVHEVTSPQAFDGLRKSATQSKNTLERLHAIWGIGQIARATYPTGYVRELAAMSALIGDADETVAGATMAMLGEARVVNAQPAILSRLNSQSPKLLARAISAGATHCRSRPWSRSRTRPLPASILPDSSV